MGTFPESQNWENALRGGGAKSRKYPSVFYFKVSCSHFVCECNTISTNFHDSVSILSIIVRARKIVHFYTIFFAIFKKNKKK